jgi:hypothetical protein
MQQFAPWFISSAWATRRQGPLKALIAIYQLDDTIVGHS